MPAVIERFLGKMKFFVKLELIEHIPGAPEYALFVNNIGITHDSKTKWRS